VDWVLGEPKESIVDLAAGTGALTRELVTRSTRVFAIEPDPAMRAMLVKHVPGVPAIAATGEQLPLRSSAFDALTVSSAWHWMDPAVASMEVGRVLRPDGVFGLLWNGADRSIEWVQELLGPGSSRPYPPGSEPTTPHELGAHHLRHNPGVPDTAPFYDIQSTVIAWSKSFTVDELVGLMGTYSRIITLAPTARDQILENVRTNGERRLHETGGSSIEVPMRCECWRAIRG
jgi:SAM-dependent methyltransferase